jgi:hypothetical protein
MYGGLWSLQYPFPDNNWSLFGIWCVIFIIIDLTVSTVRDRRHKSRQPR